MSTISDNFQLLLQTTGQFPSAMSSVPLHGFLTAIAIGPQDAIEEDTLLTTLLGGDGLELDEARMQEIVSLTWECIADIEELLTLFDYTPMLATETVAPPRPDLWLRGFNQAVALAEKGWRELNDEHLAAGRQYLFLQSFAEPDIAATVFSVPPEEYDSFVHENLPLIGPSLEALYQNYWGDQDDFSGDDELGFGDFDPRELPKFDPGELRQQSDAELLVTIRSCGDLLPREVVDEAICRDEPMAILLTEHLENPANWDEEAAVDEWWALLHALFILGDIPGEEATKGLLHGIQRIQIERSNNLWDWVSGYWPALFRNKRELAREGLQQIAFNRDLDWYPRASALDCLLEAAWSAAPEAMTEMLTRIEGIAADETENWDFRLSASHLLLCFPREQHRETLTRLAELQQEREEILSFNQADIDRIYGVGKDEPEWQNLNNPLEFYDPQRILDRQRWSDQEDEWDKDVLSEPDDFDPFQDHKPITYVRDTPKIGRNDPCPCGSGKKYKKCCLFKRH